MATDTNREKAIAAVRAFNRFYTKQIGILEAHYLKSQFSLTQMRVIYELAHHENTTATDLIKQLGIDPGYLSRILDGFEKQRLIKKTQSKEDGRQIVLALTKQGEKAFAPLDAGASEQVGAMLGKLSTSEQDRLVKAMGEVEELLGEPSKDVPCILRSHRPGDIGWVTYRHGALYAQEYGYDERFEALVAEVAAKFIQNFDPKRERCWIAERNGETIGSVFLVKASDDVAKLRLLYVEPAARGI